MSDETTTPEAADPEDARWSIRETRLRARKAEGRWPMGPDERAETIAQALAIVADPKGKARNKLAAMRILAAFEQQNMEQEKRDQQIPDRSEVRVLIEYVDADPPTDEAAPGATSHP